MNQNNIIRFISATIYARKIEVKKELVRLTGGHRSRLARAENGYVIIDKQWFPT